MRPGPIIGTRNDRDRDRDQSLGPEIRGYGTGTGPGLRPETFSAQKGPKRVPNDKFSLKVIFD